MLPAGHVCSLCPPITGWKGQRAFLLPRTECRTQRSHYASLNRRLCLTAIILFSAADVSPPFLNWAYSAAFSSAGSAISDRNEASRSYDLGNTEQGADGDWPAGPGDMAWRNPEKWQKEVQALWDQFTSLACSCKFALESLSIYFWPQYSLKKLRSHQRGRS